MISQSTLVKNVAEQTGMNQKDVKLVLDATGELIAATIKDDEVRIFQGLTIGSVERAARTGRNPQTGESIEIPARRAPKAKFGKYFKDALL